MEVIFGVWTIKALDPADKHSQTEFENEIKERFLNSIKVENDQRVTCNLVGVRSRVAPLKDISILRLEPLGCCIGMILAKTMCEDLKKLENQIKEVATIFEVTGIDLAVPVFLKNGIGAHHLLQKIDWDKVIADGTAKKIVGKFKPPVSPWWGG
ncbi:hypothetical protein TNCV_1146251 [Trichonephila clavipes]|nr:hypothetical protein TNCV_1146251 [Trichonephila clavipes]